MIDMSKGYDINWAMPSAQMKTDPRYLKYSNTALGTLVDELGAIQGVLATMKPNTESAEIISYYAWLVRTINLVVAL